MLFWKNLQLNPLHRDKINENLWLIENEKNLGEN